MRTKHYDTVVSTLVNAIQEHWSQESKGELSLDDDFESASQTQMSPDWQSIIGPKRRNYRKEQDQKMRIKFI